MNSSLIDLLTTRYLSCEGPVRILNYRASLRAFTPCVPYVHSLRYELGLDLFQLRPLSIGASPDNEKLGTFTMVPTLTLIILREIPQLNRFLDNSWFCWQPMRQFEKENRPYRSPSE